MLGNRLLCCLKLGTDLLAGDSPDLFSENGTVGSACVCLLGCWWEDREDPTIWRATEEEVLGAWWEQGTAAAFPRRPVLPHQRDQYDVLDDRTRSGTPVGERKISRNDHVPMAG